MHEAPVRDRRGVLAGMVVGITAFVYLLSFPPTLNPSDESLFLYGAKRIRDGQALYRDFFEFITPAGFYLFALVYAVAGTTLQAARGAMVTVNAVSAVLVYVLARKVAGTLEGLLAAAVFVVACVPVWNMASPHWLSTCICLATAVAVLGDRWAASTALRPAVAGALAGLSFATQQQRGVFLGVWLAAALLLLPGGGVGRLGLRWLRGIGWTAAGWVPVVLAILGYAAWRSSVGELVHAIFTHVMSAYGPTFVGKMSWGGTMWFTKYAVDYTWPWLPILVPGVLALETATLLLRPARHRNRPEAIRAALLLLAAAMAGAIFYFPDLVHVSFILPFTLVVTAGVVHRVRTIPLLRGGKRLAQVALTLCLGVVIHKGWRTMALAHHDSPLRYETAFGTVAGDEKGRRMWEGVRADVSAVPADRRTAFSYPYDASLYLTLPAENPTPFSLLTPGYNTPEQFRTAFEALERRRADFVIVASWFVRTTNDPMLKWLTGRYEASAMPRWVVVYRRVQP